MQEKTLRKLGWLASTMAVLMYVSYVDQIRLNLGGHKGSAVLPLVTVVNCGLWMAYGTLREHKDWPIIVANVPGIVLGVIAFVTAL
jgi:uncharacterized protein with PQ loop repeat